MTICGELIKQCYVCLTGGVGQRRSGAVELITNTIEAEDDRRPAEQLPDASILALRSRAEVNFPDIEALLGRIRVSARYF